MNIKRAVSNQASIFNILKTAKKNNRLSHAYLFYGGKGTGKKEMAYALATLFYCPNGGCLDCPVCNTIIDGNHMNVNYIGIEDKKKSISKEQITDLQEEYSKTSFVDGVRVYIVDGIDTATVQAQNSLLKFIEEPQNKTQTVGIFIANEVSNVLSTIQSRCELVHFDSIPKEKIVSFLEEDNINRLDAVLLSELTNDTEEAKEFYDMDYYHDTKNLFLELIGIDTKRNGVVFYVKNVNYFYSKPEALRMLLVWIIIFLEDVNNYTEAKDNLILDGLCDKIEKYRNKNNNLREKLEDILKLERMLDSNISSKNVFFSLVDKFI